MVAAFCGFFGFLVAGYLTVLALAPHTGEDRGIELLLAAGLAGAVIVPLLLWRWRSSPDRAERWFTTMAAVLGFFVFAGVCLLIVGGIWPDVTPLGALGPLVVAGIVGGVLAVLLMRRCRPELKGGGCGS